MTLRRRDIGTLVPRNADTVAAGAEGAEGAELTDGAATAAGAETGAATAGLGAAAGALVLWGPQAGATLPRLRWQRAPMAGTGLSMKLRIYFAFIRIGFKPLIGP